MHICARQSSVRREALPERCAEADMRTVFGDFRNLGDIDYVVCWFRKSSRVRHSGNEGQSRLRFYQFDHARCKVRIVWAMLFGKFHIKIHFAHRTFAWMSEARGSAHVHVVIIGFAAFDTDRKTIVDYEPDSSRPSVISVANISPYLTPGSDAFVTKQTRPLANVPEIRCGNKPFPTEGTSSLRMQRRRNFFVRNPVPRGFCGGSQVPQEFINGNMRWCLWLVDATPAEIRALPKVMERVQKVREFRKRSSAAPTRAAAQTPSQFFYLNPQLFRVYPHSRGFVGAPHLRSNRYCPTTDCFGEHQLSPADQRPLHFWNTDISDAHGLASCGRGATRIAIPLLWLDGLQHVSVAYYVGSKKTSRGRDSRTGSSRCSQTLPSARR